MGLFTSRRQVMEDVPVVPVVAPHMSVDGWTLAGTPLGARIRPGDQRELATLLHGVSIGVDTPYTYERACDVLDRIGEVEQALAVCESWLSHPASERPTSATTTRLLTKRRARLQAKVVEVRQSSPAKTPAPRAAPG
ncbi:MAG: hypothetical protein ACRDYU_05945 [Actinomycetes bacterium]